MSNDDTTRELEKLRSKLLKMETDAASEIFETDTHERNEGRKDDLVSTVIGAIQNQMGHSDDAKAVVNAVVDATKQK